MAHGLSPDLAWRLLDTMLLMRRFEETVQGFAEEKRFSGHYHLYIGQEAAGAASIAALGPGDRLATTHRNHGHILARGADPAAALAEILGKATGLNRGHGGTFHLCAPELGFLSTSGIVGGAISLAVGGAYACRQRGDGAVAAAFFGDGALDEGVSFEALRLAALWRLPVVFFCENNDAPEWDRALQGFALNHAARDLRALPGAVGIEAARVDGANAADVFSAMSEAVARCRAGRGPVFIESMTREWPGNAQQFPTLATGVTDLGMATGQSPIPGTHRAWYETEDPVLRLARTLAASGGADRVRALDRAVAARIAAARAFALESPLPPPQAALDHVFA